MNQRTTEKEKALQRCALMILHDQCPPDRKHYLCMKSEDDTGDCTLCWDRYLWGIMAGTVQVPKEERGAAV